MVRNFTPVHSLPGALLELVRRHRTLLCLRVPLVTRPTRATVTHRRWKLLLISRLLT